MLMELQDSEGYNNWNSEMESICMLMELQDSEGG